MKFVALVALAVIASANASTVGSASAARSGFLGNLQAGGDLIVKFTTGAGTIAAGTGTITITPSNGNAAFFTAAVADPGSDTTCTAKVGAATAKTVAKAKAIGAAGTLTITMTDEIAANSAVTVTCTDNLKNFVAAGAITFTIKTSGDTADLAGVVGYTVTTGKQVLWTSAARTTLSAGAAGGNLVVTFTPTTEVATGGTITITPSTGEAFFTAVANTATACTATSNGVTKAVTSAVAAAGGVLTVTMTPVLAAANAVVITCTDNLAVNTAAGAVTFKLKTSTDTGELLAQTGYIITTAPSKAGASGASGKVITIKQVATLGIDAADYPTGLYKKFTERSMGITLGICSGNCTSYTAGHTMTSAAARRASCTVTFTVVVPDADASTKVITAGKAITKAILNAAMTALKAADTATYAAFTPPTVKTVVAPTGGAVAASASTTTVGIFSALCLAVAALRQ